VRRKTTTSKKGTHPTLFFVFKILSGARAFFQHRQLLLTERFQNGLRMASLHHPLV
jgi:hypothetical protein